MTTRRYSCGGLMTDPAPTGPVPEGAMEEAKDVVIRRQNIATSRPRFGDVRNTSLGHVHDLIPYDGDILVSNQWTLVWESAHTTAITGAPTAAGAGYWPVPTTEARDNLYVGGADGVHKLTSGGAAAAVEAGIDAPPTLQATSTSGSTVLDTQKAVGYRAIAEREDANGVIAVSAPTGHKVLANHHASNTYDANLTMYVAHLQAGDVVKVFRSRAVTSTASTDGWPSDDLYLVYTRELTASDISTGAFSVVDSLAEADMGEPLYTNPMREGYPRANIPPPYCEAMALYKGSVFYANTVGPQSMTLEADIGGNQTGNAAGIGYRTISGSITIGTNTVTIADTTGLKVGMICVNGTAWTGDTPVVITSITPNTSLTVDTNADATISPGDITYYDTIRIDDDYYVAMNPFLEYGLVTPANDYSDAAPAIHLVSPGTDHRYRVHTDASADSVELTKVTYVFHEDARGGGTFDFYATHGDEYFPPLEEPTASATATSADTWPNAIYFSKKDQPEHVPLPNYFFVGAADHPIQRIVPARDALWVFKTDGIYRVTGQGERTGWRVDAYDLSASLIHRAYAVELDGNVYAWTTKGVLMLGEMGDRNISRGAIGNLLLAHEEAYGVDTADSTDFGACWADPINHEVYFSDKTGGYLYVFNTKTGAWVRWTNGHITNADCGTWASGCWNPADGLTYMGMSKEGAGSGYILQEDNSGESSVDAEIAWTDHADDPGITQMFQDVVILWEDRSSMVAYDVDFDSSISDTPTTQSYTNSDTFAGATPAYVPRGHAVTTRLGVKVTTEQQFGEGRREWSVTGMRINSAPVTTKVAV